MVHQLTYTDYRTYLYSALFVTGNIVLPQICHLVPQGGLIFLPIYFFTLIAAYKYGIIPGLLTAVMSPIMNHLLFGMPAAPVLPIILVKGTILALVASYLSRRFGRVTFTAIVLTVLGYQLLGGVAEWLMTQSSAAAIQDLRLGYPGILLQIVVGYFFLKRISQND